MFDYLDDKVTVTQSFLSSPGLQLGLWNKFKLLLDKNESQTQFHLRPQLQAEAS